MSISNIPITGAPAGPVAGGGALPGPDSVANLAHWYNLDSLARLYQDSAMTTPVAADSDPVGAWVDQIVAADVVIQATAGSRPTYIGVDTDFNNQPSLSLDGGDWLQVAAFAAALPQPISMWIVQKYASGSYLLSDGGDAVPRVLVNAGVWQINAGSSLNTGAPNTNPNIHLIVWNGTSSEHWRNGILLGSGNTSTSAFDGFTLAARNDGVAPEVAKITEVIMYSAVSSTADRNVVQNYLANKYAISVTEYL